MSRASSYTSSKTVKRPFLLLPLAACAAVAAPRGFTLYNVVPLSIGREATAAADAVELQTRTGVDLALYSLTLHPEGVPASEKAERYVESFRAFKRAHAAKGRVSSATCPLPSTKTPFSG